MTNDTTRTMPTVEEISELANLVDSTCWGEESRHDAAVMLRTIADQMRKTEPVARAMVGYKLEWVGPNWGCDVAPGTLLYTIPLADAENEINIIELFPNTVQLDEKDIHKACETFIRESDYTVVCPEEWMAEAIKSIAPPIKSVSDALNFLEEWALSGNTLHGDDIQRLHATVERITPIAKPVKVPDALNPFDSQPEGLGYADGWNACREAMLSTSPQPQQAVPEVDKK